MTKWAKVHNKLNLDTALRFLRKAHGSSATVAIMAQDFCEMGMFGKLLYMRFPLTTTYRMHVITSSMIDLGYIHDMAAYSREARRAAGVGNVHVRVSDADHLSVLVLLVQTGDEDFPRVAAHHGGENNEKESEVSSVKNGIGQAENKHPLRAHKHAVKAQDT